MPEQDDRADGPSLELPSFGFRRKKRQPTVEETEPAATEPAPEPTSRPEPEPEPVPTYEEVSVADVDPPLDPASGSRPGLPELAPVPAAMVTGLVVGLLTVGLVRASQGICEVARGTSSCGNAGILLLLAILVLAGWLGSALLRGFGVTDAGSTSALAVGLVAVTLMLFLGGQLFAWWMVIAVPVVAVLAYAIAHRVTTAMVEPAGPEMHR